MSSNILDGIDQRSRLAGQNRMELLLFRLSGRQRFGINVFKVQEVISCPHLTNIPGASDVVMGVANMRGKTIPVVDLSMAVGGPPLGVSEDRYVIISEYSRRSQGFLVGAVERIVNMGWEEILPPPKGSGDDNYVTAVTSVDDELVEIIDVEKVLQEVICHEDEELEGIGSESMADGEVSSEGLHVLVVDDSSVARNQMKKVLSKFEFEVTTCNNGREGLDQLLTWQKEGKDLENWLLLVLSDVEMPMMDGYTMVSKIRENSELKNLYVIMHTSLSGVFNEAMVKKAGADRFLEKYDPDDLAEAIQTRMAAVKERRAGTSLNS